MKLPRYLQIGLVLSCLLCLWSFFSAPEATQQQEWVRPQTRTKVIVSPAAQTTAAVTENAVNLFPFQGQKPTPSTTEVLSAPPTEAEPVAPPLPFQVNGAWWYQRHRALILTDGKQQWIICRQCRARDKIWTGATLNHDWQLVKIGPDFLTFRWLPQQLDQRLALGDMTSKPTL